MATLARPANTSETAPAEPAGGLRYVARQPILDLRGRVHGYELLFRAGQESAFRGDGDTATRTMLDNTLIFGLEKLTAGLPAFVNCTMEALTGDLVDVLPPSMTVLEILETLEPTPELIASCRKLKLDGFRLALDDFVWHPKFKPLVALADYIKVEFSFVDPAGRKRLRDRLGKAPVAMVAEKVESQEEYKQACEEGFTLFQGYYFCHPTLLKSRKIPANWLSYTKILELLQRDTMDMRRVGPLVKRDPSLTYRLLRFVNSPLYMVRQEVSSIDAALVMVGETAFRRIATLAIAAELNGNQPAEILRMAFVRGKFCELAAELCGLNATEQYLLGMLSLLPAMLRLTIEELAPSLPLRKEICRALHGCDNPERILLSWLVYHEKGEWAVCDAVVEAHGLNRDRLIKCYADSVVWAESALHFAS
jgi:EAL and modified HD-GYP domain-containing signal transduction protein